MINTKLSHTLLISASPDWAVVAAATLGTLGAGREVTAIAEADTWAYLRRAGQWLAASRSDLIVLDMSAPLEPAWALRTSLKGAADFKCIPIVAWIAAHDTAASDRAYDLHANACLAQPPDAATWNVALRAIWTFWLDVVKRPAPMTA